MILSQWIDGGTYQISEANIDLSDDPTDAMSEMKKAKLNEYPSFDDEINKFKISFSTDKLVQEESNSVVAKEFQITLINNLTGKDIAKSEKFKLDSVVNENNISIHEEKVKDFAIKFVNLVKPCSDNLEAGDYSK